MSSHEKLLEASSHQMGKLEATELKRKSRKDIKVGSILCLEYLKSPSIGTD